MNLPGAVKTRPGSLQECQLGGKAVGGLERGQGFMNRLILMVILMVMVMVVVMMALVTMTTGECDYGLGDDGDPRGQGERRAQEEADAKKESWIVFFQVARCQEGGLDSFSLMIMGGRESFFWRGTRIHFR